MAIGDNLTIPDGFGATRFPVDATLVGTEVTAAALDPGQDAIIGLLKAAINADAGAVWKRLITQLPDKHFLKRVKLSESNPANSTTDEEPNPALTTQELFDWPLLAVFPSGQPEAFEMTMSLGGLRQNWSVIYLIGPLDAAWRRKLGRGICRLVYRSVQRAIRFGYHPAYQNGRRQFFGQYSEIKVIGCNGPGVLEILDKDHSNGYYGLEVTLQTTERTVHDENDETEDPTNYGYVTAGTGTLTDTWEQTELDVTTENQTADTVSYLDLFGV